jgi:hypothetical protein
MHRGCVHPLSARRLHSPEQLEPDVNVDRTTASVIYNSQLSGNDWQTTFAWGRDAPNGGTVTDAYLLESAVNFQKTHTLFARLERVEKNELFLHPNPLADEVFRVNKLSVGYVYDFPTEKRFKFGLGGLVSAYSLPSELNTVYGHPTSYMIFARLKLQ